MVLSDAQLQAIAGKGASALVKKLGGGSKAQKTAGVAGKFAGKHLSKIATKAVKKIAGFKKGGVIVVPHSGKAKAVNRKAGRRKK